jgi:hypothetical protein
MEAGKHGHHPWEGTLQWILTLDFKSTPPQKYSFIPTSQKRAANGLAQYPPKGAPITRRSSRAAPLRSDIDVFDTKEDESDGITTHNSMKITNKVPQGHRMDSKIKFGFKN